MNGQRAVATIVACLLATVVVPPLFAWTINQRRMADAKDDASAIVEGLGINQNALRRFAQGIDVLCGPGLVPRAGPGAEPWLAGPRAPLSAALGDGRVPMDPWGNCYTVNLTALRSDPSGPVWVLSAGPDGILETPYTPSPLTLGNDIGVRVR